MIDFLSHILTTYTERPVRIAVAQKPPRFPPLGWWEMNDGIIEKCLDLNLRRDVFISPLFRDKFVFLTADLDGGLPESFDEQPTYLTKTSENHYQAIWFTEPMTADEWLAKQKIIKKRYNADATYGLKYVARIPASYNFKRQFQTEVL